MTRFSIVEWLGRLFAPTPAPAPAPNPAPTPAPADIHKQARPIPKPAPVIPPVQPRCAWYKPELEGRRNLLREKLTEIAPRFTYTPLLADLGKLPERIQSTEKIQESSLSPAASSFLERLDAVHRENPLPAIAFAAYTFAACNPQHMLAQEAARRVCDWLQEDSAPSQERIDMGIVVWREWPESHYQLPGLHSALVDLLADESNRDRAFVLSRLPAPYGRWANGILVTSTDAPAKLLLAARNLRGLDPEFAKSALQNYLRIAANPVSPQHAPEAEIRQAAAELFALECEIPAADGARTVTILNDLILWGHTDAPWYDQALAQLEDAASGAWSFAVIAVNAPAYSPLRARAIEAFRHAANDYQTIPRISPHLLHVANLLADIPQDVDNDAWHGGIRNAHIPCDPQQPLREIARTAFWNLVDWLQQQPSAIVLTVLLHAIESDENPDAEQAIALVEALFEAKARQYPAQSELMLIRLANNNWFSNVSKTRRARCRKLFNRLLPLLEAQSPEAAERARKELLPARAYM